MAKVECHKRKAKIKKIADHICQHGVAKKKSTWLMGGCTVCLAVEIGMRIVDSHGDCVALLCDDCLGDVWIMICDMRR